MMEVPQYESKKEKRPMTTRETQAEKPADTNPSPKSDANRDGKVDSLADAEAAKAKEAKTASKDPKDAPHAPDAVYNPAKKVYQTPKQAFEEAKADFAVAKETFRKAEECFIEAKSAFDKAEAAPKNPATPMTEADPFDAAHRARADATNRVKHDREVDEIYGKDLTDEQLAQVK